MSQAASVLGRGFDERIPVLLVLDTSASMGRPEHEPRIGRLNAALGDWFADASAQPGLRGRIEIAIITFDSAIRVLDPGGGPDRPGGAASAFRLIADAHPPQLRASGFSLMLPAIETALQLATEHKRTLEVDGIPSRRPLIWLLTDGAPSDETGAALAPADLAATAQRLRAEEAAGRCLFFAIGVAGADLHMLEVLAPASTMMLSSFSYREILRFVSRSSDNVKSSDSVADVYLQTREQVTMLEEISSLEETI